ncbi:MAG: hypothetical protein ACJ77B_07845 [Chloroflexota bacterium]
MTPEPDRAWEWTPARVALVVAGIVAAVGIRAALLPTPGLAGDIDQFVVWTNGIATHGLGRAYDQNISFAPVMVWIWGFLALVDPAFRTATDSSDVAVRVAMKLPAVIADAGLALGVAYALRARPGWAVVGGLAIALHPAVIDVGAWWGQYDAVYALFALVAYLLAVGGRPGWGAVAIALAVMTKPQALPLAVPFAAFYLARFGVAGSIRYGALALVTVAIVWLPFIGAGGPVAYLHNLAEYQGGVFAILSLRAWNLWWLLQTALGDGSFIADSAAIAGPITIRTFGYLIAIVLEAIVFVSVWRSPSSRTLALGMAASALLAFGALTAMHERYAFAAIVFLMLGIPEPRIRWLAIVFGVAYTANLLAAAPPTAGIAAALPVTGPIATVGTLAILAVTAAVVALMFRAGRQPRDMRSIEPTALAAT